MNNRLINFGLVIAFFLCYMEWGGGNSSFIFQAEHQILIRSEGWRSNLTHPIILAGLIGQIILLYCAVWNKGGKKLNWLGILILSPVVFIILLAGALSLNWKMLLSVLPFIVLAILFWRNNRRKNGSASS